MPTVKVFCTRARALTFRPMTTLKVALAQIAPAWLDRAATTLKVLDYMGRAKEEDCDLVVFGEGLLPGYPFWLAYTEGAAWDRKVNKELHAHYARNAVCIEEGNLRQYHRRPRARTGRLPQHYRAAAQSWGKQSLL